MVTRRAWASVGLVVVAIAASSSASAASSPSPPPSPGAADGDVPFAIERIIERWTEAIPPAPPDACADPGVASCRVCLEDSVAGIGDAASGTVRDVLEPLPTVGDLRHFLAAVCAGVQPCSTLVQAVDDACREIPRCGNVFANTSSVPDRARAIADAWRSSVPPQPPADCPGVDLEPCRSWSDAGLARVRRALEVTIQEGVAGSREAFVTVLKTVAERCGPVEPCAHAYREAVQRCREVPQCAALLSG